MEKIYKKIAVFDYVNLLSYPPYLFFSISVFFSQVAFNMLNVVLIFLVFYLTSSSFAVALILIAILIPQIILSFFGGVFADLSDKKKILIFGNLLRAIPLVILFLNPSSLFYVYSMAIIISILTQFYVPAEAPLIPTIVKKEKLIPANSIFGISLFGSILIGYVLAGPIITGLGRAGVFLFLAALFLIASFFAFSIPDRKIVSKLKKDDAVDEIKRSLKEELRESYSVLRNTKEVSGAFFLLSFSQVIILVLATLVPSYANSILQVRAEDLSLILFGPAALGMIISALLLGSVYRNALKAKIMTTGVFISGVVLILLPFASKTLLQQFILFVNVLLPQFLTFGIYHFVLILAFFAGFANALIFVPSQALIQENVPEDFRSKIYGLLFSLIGIFSLIPILVAGGVADLIGVGSVLTTIGILVLLVGFIRQKMLSRVVLFVLRRKKF